MKNNQKKQKKEDDEIQSMETFDKLAFIKHLSEVQSRIKDQITSDFVYAKLDEKDKEGVIEMTNNAYYGHRLIIEIAKKATKWEWNQKQQQWEKRNYNKTETETLLLMSNNTFDAFMTRPTMTVNMNRNVKNNYLIRMSAGLPEEEKEEEEIGDEKETLKLIKQNLKQEPNT